jgi:hypothetical protein
VSTETRADTRAAITAARADTKAISKAVSKVEVRLLWHEVPVDTENEPAQAVNTFYPGWGSRQSSGVERCTRPRPLCIFGWMS